MGVTLSQNWLAQARLLCRVPGRNAEPNRSRGISLYWEIGSVDADAYSAIYELLYLNDTAFDNAPGRLAIKCYYCTSAAERYKLQKLLYVGKRTNFSITSNIWQLVVNATIP